MKPPLLIVITKSMLLIIGGIFLYFSIRSGIKNIYFIQNSTITQGYIYGFHTKSSSNSDGSSSDSKYPEVMFVDHIGKTRYITSSSSSIFSSIGDKVNVRYIKGQSRNARISSFSEMWGAITIGGLFGIVFTYFGFLLVLNLLEPFLSKRRAKNYTKTIHANIKEVLVDQSTFVNGKFPFIIKAYWKDAKTEEIYTFYSEQLWEDPSNKLGDKITVKLNDDLSDYWMDTLFLHRANT